MDKKQIEALHIQRARGEEKIAERQKKRFLEETLKDAKDEFQHYEKGYRTFSVKCPQGKHFSIDNEIITTIIDGISNKYECHFHSFALTEVIYPKSYTFVFYKEMENKDEIKK